MSVPSVTMMASIGVRYLAAPSIAFFILGTFWVTKVRTISSLLYNENPGHDDRGFLSLQHFAMQGNASSQSGDKSMRTQYANASKSCNKYRRINHQLPNDIISRSITLPRVLALLAVSRKAK